MMEFYIKSESSGEYVTLNFEHDGKQNKYY